MWELESEEKYTVEVVLVAEAGLNLLVTKQNKTFLSFKEVVPLLSDCGGDGASIRSPSKRNTFLERLILEIFGMTHPHVTMSLRTIGYLFSTV